MLLRNFFSFENTIWAQIKDATLHFNRFQRFSDQPVVARGPNGSPDEHRVASTNVIRTDDHFTMWYTGMRPPHANPWHQEDRHSVCIAYSPDGINWDKPDLGLKKTSSGKAPNNTLNLSNDFYNIGVLRESDGYVMKYEYPRGLKVDESQTTFTIFASDDGIHWHGRRKPCIQKQHFESQNSLFKVGKWYYVMGQGISPYFEIRGQRECGRVNFTYRTHDLKHWALVPGASYAYPIIKHFPRSGLQTHCGATVKDRGRIHLGFMGQFWPAGFSESVFSTFGLIYSYDGRKWTEPFIGEPLLLPDQNGWDCGMLMQGNGCYSRGAHTYYWYVGGNGGNLWTTATSAGICRIRRDGFTYFKTEKHRRQATLNTCPITLNKHDTTLYINASASVASPLRVRVKNVRTGQTLTSKVMKAGGVLQPVVGLNTLPHLPKQVCISFELHNRAALYAFYLGPKLNKNQYLDRWQ